MKYFLFFALIPISLSPVIAQSNKILQAYFQDIRQNKRMPMASLMKLERKDFNEVAVDSLIKFLERGYPHKIELIRLIGFAGIPNDISKIKKYSGQENEKSIRWSALLAM